MGRTWGSAKKSDAMARVLAAIAFRDQHLDALAQQFGAGIAEELFGLSVHQRDFSLVVDDDHRVGRGFEQRAEFFFGLFSHSDISYSARDEDAVGSLDGAETDLEREFRTIFSQAKQIELCAHRPLTRIAKKRLCDGEDGDGGSVRESALLPDIPAARGEDSQTAPRCAKLIRTMRPRWSTITIASGADSEQGAKLVFRPLARGYVAYCADHHRPLRRLSSGLRLISTGNSLPFLRRP